MKAINISCYYRKPKFIFNLLLSVLFYQKILLAQVRKTNTVATSKKISPYLFRLFFEGIKAVYIPALERTGDIVRLPYYAPLLTKNNFTRCKTGLIFFDNFNACPTSTYNAQKMFSANAREVYYSNVIEIDDKDTTQAASGMQDSKTGGIILKRVNFNTVAKTFKVYFSRSKNILPKAMLTVSAGKPCLVVSFKNSCNIQATNYRFIAGKNFIFSGPG